MYSSPDRRYHVNYGLFRLDKHWGDDWLGNVLVRVFLFEEKGKKNEIIFSLSFLSFLFITKHIYITKMSSREERLAKVTK